VLDLNLPDAARALSLAAIVASPLVADAATPLRHRVMDRTIELRPEPHRVLALGADGIAPVPSAGETVDASAPSLPPGWSAWIVAERDAASAIAAVSSREEIAFAAPMLRCADGHWRIPTPEVLIGVQPAFADDGSIGALLAEFGLDMSTIQARDEWRIEGLLRVRPALRDGMALVRLADRIADDPRVRFAEPDFLMQGLPGGGAAVSDPQFPSQWGLHNVGQSTICGSGSSVTDIDVNAPEAWSLVQASPEIIVLVIDNGIQFDHPDLWGDPTLGFDPTPDAGGGWPMHACDNHGTAVVGVIAAMGDNGIGIAGLAHGARFASARISMPDATCQTWTVQASWVAASLAWGESIGVSISNTSWAFQPSAIVTEAYAQRAANGMLHFACSHNQGSPSVTFPANLPTVVAVGALARSGNLASFSNWGVDQELVAPGVAIRTTDRTGSAGYGGGNYACVNGTSFASPLAAATAALMRSANPQLDGEQLRALLQMTATDLGTPGWNPTFGHGLVRADAAVAAALALVDNPGDLNGDGVVDGADLGILLNAWLLGDPIADLNGDGVVDGADLGILLNAW